MASDDDRPNLKPGDAVWYSPRNYSLPPERDPRPRYAATVMGGPRKFGGSGMWVVDLWKLPDDYADRHGRRTATEWSVPVGHVSRMEACDE